jgi:hypothetical protein
VTAPIAGNTPAAPPPQLGADDDAMSEIYTMISNLRANQLAAGESQVDADDEQVNAERVAQQAALAQAEGNGPTSGRGFFSSIGHFFSDVAGDVVHGKLGSAIDDAGRDITEAWNSPQFMHDLKVGCEDVAIVAAAVATAVCTYGTGSTAAAIGAAAAMTAASAAGTAGGAAVRVQQFAATAEDANANATADADKVQELEQLVADVLADLKQSDKANQQTTQSLTQAIQTNDATVVAPSTTTVRG